MQYIYNTIEIRDSVRREVPRACVAGLYMSSLVFIYRAIYIRSCVDFTCMPSGRGVYSFARLDYTGTIHTCMHIMYKFVK